MSMFMPKKHEPLAIGNVTAILALKFDFFELVHTF